MFRDIPVLKPYANLHLHELYYWKASKSGSKKGKPSSLTKASVCTKPWITVIVQYTMSRFIGRASLAQLFKIKLD